MRELAQLRVEIDAALRRLEHRQVAKVSGYLSDEDLSPDIDCVAFAMKAIRCRKEVIDDINECGWAILLDLYANYGRTRVSVSSACIGSMYATTTALRWLEVLCQRGMIERQCDPSDARRIFVGLTPVGFDLIERWRAGMAKPDAKSSR